MSIGDECQRSVETFVRRDERASCPINDAPCIASIYEIGYGIMSKPCEDDEHDRIRLWAHRDYLDRVSDGIEQGPYAEEWTSRQRLQRSRHKAGRMSTRFEK